MSDSYKVDMRKLTFREAWRWGGLPHVISLGILKLSGAERYGSNLVPGTTGIIRVDPKSVLERQHTLMSPILSELRQEGFDVAFWYRVDTIPVEKSVAVSTLNRSKDTMANVIYANSGKSEQASFGLISTAGDGSYLSTNNVRNTFNPAPQFKVVRLLNSSVSKIVETHQKRVAEMFPPAVPIPNPETLIVELQRITKDENIRRGLYVPA